RDCAPAPTDAGGPRGVRAWRAWEAVVSMAGSCAGTGMMGPTATPRQAQRWTGGLRRQQAPGAVDAGIAGEVPGDGVGGNVLAAGEPGHGVGVEAEAAEVVAEVQHAAGREPGHRRAQQAHVLALDEIGR